MCHCIKFTQLSQNCEQNNCRAHGRNDRIQEIGSQKFKILLAQQRYKT